jgi:hypothetical protein
MQRVPTIRVVTAIAAIPFLLFLAACGGGSTSSSTVVSQILLSPTTVSLNEGAVVGLSAVAENSSGGVVAADLTFASSNNNVATISSGGLICGGVWDANIINCNATNGPDGVGQVTITVSSTNNITATATVYVHEQVDQVVAVVNGDCTTMGQAINISGLAYSTSAPGCSPSAPCDITSTVGPFTFSSNDTSIAATSAGIASTFSSSTDSPTYTSGGTTTGSKGQTCNLSSFNGVTNATATVALTGNNTIAAGTQLTVTNSGYGGLVAPTTATLTSGTATCSGTATVITALTSGVLTAETPGLTTTFASVSGVNSVAVPYLTCPVNSINIHSSSDSTTTFILNATNTQGLTADVYDTHAQYIQPKLTWGSSLTAVATVATGTTGNNPATVTAVAPGTAYITASCSYPNCNKGVPAQYSQNIVTTTVNGGNATTVYAASTNSLSLIPIPTTTNTAGTAITLPNYPNSIVADPSGSVVYLGSSSGLMAVTVSSGTVTNLGVHGTVLAITPDSLFLLIDDTATNLVYYYSVSGASYTLAPANAALTGAAYTPDSSFNEWVAGTQWGLGYPTGLIGLPTLPYTANSLDLIAEGGLSYITAPGQVTVYSTCNQAQGQVLTANNPTLIKALPNGTGAVATDSPNIDLVSTVPPLSTGCPITTTTSLGGYDMGVGAYTPQQLFMSPDNNYAYIISNLPELLVFNLPGLAPSTVPFVGGATAFNGGITPDSSRIYVGTSDSTVHMVQTFQMQDQAQIAVNLKDANGVLTTPNLVCVVP